MKLAIIGSRNIGYFDLDKVIPDGVTEIISGGARGIDSIAAEYAIKNGISLLEIKPDYKRYGKSATFIRNRMIVDAADEVMAIWDGASKGTAYTINYAKAQEVPVRIVLHHQSAD